MATEPADNYRTFAEFYDYVAPYRNREDIHFFVELALDSKGPALEIGCGTGRVLIPTARAGTEITGLDNSPAMLAALREKLAREPKGVQARVHLVEADMRSFELDRKFALITTPFRSFQHLLEVNDQITCLQCIRRHLIPSGKLVLDLFNPDMRRLAHLIEHSSHEEEISEFTMPDGRKIILHIRVRSEYPLEQTLDLSFNHDVTYPDGRRERLSQQFRTRYFFRYEIEHLLKLAGFRIECAYGGYDKSPLGAAYPGELIYIAAPQGA